MVALTERLLEMQAKFCELGRPHEVSIGYHYTKSANMSRIRTNGLLSRSEREARFIHTITHGSLYGEGIYTGNNPFDFLGTYGSVGLLVLRLQGKAEVFGANIDANSFLNRPKPNDSIVVLRESSQCVATFRFDGTMLNNYRAKELLAEVHIAVQELVFTFFNHEPVRIRTRW